MFSPYLNDCNVALFLSVLSENAMKGDVPRCSPGPVYILSEVAVNLWDMVMLP